MVIWMTGLSGTGKTTLCTALTKLVRQKIPNLAVLDGDVIREVFGNDLGHSIADRHIQIGRLQRMAKMLSDQNLVVLVAAVYSNPDILTWNRTNLFPYFEIYMEASLDTLKKRDPKGIYARAQSGALQDVVGVDIPFEAPRAPDLVINTDHPESAEAIALRVVNANRALAERIHIDA